MALTGKFTKIPSGNVAPSIQNGRLEAPFKMEALFQSDTGDCSRGEYRQYVKGEFKADGKVVPHVLCGEIMLRKDVYQEDGCPPPGCTAYGYRACNSTKSHYYPTQATGGRFEGEDEPGIRARPGTLVSMDLSFKAQLINTSTHQVLAEAEWTVQGSGTIPMTTHLKVVRRNAGSEAPNVSAQVSLDSAGGAWEVTVIVPRRAPEPSLAGSAVEAMLEDSAGEALDPIKGPVDVVEVGGGRHVTASVTFRFKPREKLPAVLTVLINKMPYAFDLELLAAPESDKA